MPGGGWSCPHEVCGLCSKINNLPCNPGMKGCELAGRYVFFDGSKNTRLIEKRERAANAGKTGEAIPADQSRPSSETSNVQTSEGNNDAA